MATDSTGRGLSKIPMFDTPNIYGSSIYETTYSNDYQRKNSINANQFADYHDEMLMHKAVSKSLDNFNTSTILDSSQHLYKTNKYGLQPVHRPRRIVGINQFRSPMDPSIMNETRQTLISQSAYNREFSSFPKPKIPSYIRRDGYYHTNSEKNIRYMKSYTGALIPFIPSLPMLKNPLPAIKDHESYHEKDFPNDKPLFFTSNEELSRISNTFQENKINPTLKFNMNN